MRIIDGWKRGWKFYSVWAYTVLIASPDLYAAGVAYGLITPGEVPSGMSLAIRVIATVGLISRFIAQGKPATKDNPA